MAPKKDNDASTLPKALVVKMNYANVHKNLVNIVESLDMIRNEAVNNLGATDEQKQEYLRLTGELASCVDAAVKENPVLKKHNEAISAMLNCNNILMRYDPMQEQFWDTQEPQLEDMLANAAIVLLKDDFANETQSYHVLQALKYLNVNGNKEEVYDTILPVNSLLNDTIISSPEISGFLMKRMFEGKNTGLGVRAAIDTEAMVKSLMQAGAMYVDLPKEKYQEIRKKYPKTTMVKENGMEFARVMFTNKDVESFINAFQQLQELAQHEMSSEDNLVKKMSAFYNFGKKFLNELTGMIGTAESPEQNKRMPPKTSYQKCVIDALPAENGTYKTQDQWIQYWNNINDGRVMASMPDYYQFFKQLKNSVETDNDKTASQAVMQSLQKDFTDKWIVASTRVQYGINTGNSLEGKIVHHYGCNDASLVKEEIKEIPIYRDVGINKVIGEQKGLEYLQTYFDTSDDAETIVQLMEFISGKKRNKIKVWTADTDARNKPTDRVAALGFMDDEFLINGSDNLGNEGRARGVRYE